MPELAQQPVHIRGVQLCRSLSGTLTSGSAADLPKDVACKAWPNVPYPDGDLRCADLEMRALAAAARCAPAETRESVVAAKYTVFVRPKLHFLFFAMTNAMLTV